MTEIKRIKRDPVSHFNKKSNEDHFKANRAVTEAVEDAKASLETKDLEKTKEALLILILLALGQVSVWMEDSPRI